MTVDISWSQPRSSRQSRRRCANRTFAVLWFDCLDGGSLLSLLLQLDLVPGSARGWCYKFGYLPQWNQGFVRSTEPSSSWWEIDSAIEESQYGREGSILVIKSYRRDWARDCLVNVQYQKRNESDLMPRQGWRLWGGGLNVLINLRHSKSLVNLITISLSDQSHHYWPYQFIVSF